MRIINIRVIITIIFIIAFITPYLSINSEINHRNNDAFTNAKSNDAFCDPNYDTLEVHGTRSEVESMARGGSWLDSFEDESGIDNALSDNLEVSNDDLKIQIPEQYKFKVDSNTAALWHFDEGSGTTVQDSSSNNNDGSFQKTPTWTNGRTGTGLELDGGGQFDEGDSINVPHSGSLNFNGNFTIEAWIKAKGDQFYNCIIDKYNYTGPGDAQGYTLYLVNGKIKLSVYNGSKLQNFTGFTELRDNNWHHVAAIRENDYFSVYVDGIWDAGFTWAYFPEPNIANLGIGQRNSDQGGHMPFLGAIDEVRLSNIARSPTKLTANLTSIPHTLPASMNWDTLVINKTQHPNTYFNVTILNALDNQPIPGSPKYVDDGEFDISYIDPVEYPSIKLHATLDANSWVAPFLTLHYWGVSWNASGVWRDTIFGGAKIEDIDLDAEVGEGEVRFYDLGSLTSTPIVIPTQINENYRYESIIINKAIPEDSTLKISILDSNDNPIFNFDEFTGNFINLKTLNPAKYPTIKLRAVFGSTGAIGILYDWSVKWTINTAPKLDSISATTYVLNRTRSSRISVELIDLEEPEDELTLQLGYKGPSNTTWQTQYLTGPTYESDHWEYLFTPPSDAELGEYSFKFSCNDSFGIFDNITEPEFIEVVNNLPQIIELNTNTSEFKVYRNQSLELSINATDIEIPSDALELQIEYKSPGETVWNNEYFTDLVFEVGYWTTVFAPRIDAEVGQYSVRILCSDIDEEITIEFSILVLNHLPSQPEVTITPTAPNAAENITVTSTNATDVETPPNNLEYWLRWFINDTYEPKFDNITFISSQETNSGDEWRCVVYTFDGLELSLPVDVNVTISPAPVHDFDGDDVLDKLDAFPDDPAASVDTDGDGYPDEWNEGMSADNSTSTPKLYIDAFPNDPSASLDTDADGYPDEWNDGKSQMDSTTGLYLDAFPYDPAASIDTDGDRYPDRWNEGMTELDSTTGLKLDQYPDNPDKSIKISSDEKTDFLQIFFIVITIIIILIIIAILSTTFKSKRQRILAQNLDKNDIIISGIKQDIVEGKSTKYSDLANQQTVNLLENKHQSGELSDETYDYLKSMIYDSEEQHHIRKVQPKPNSAEKSD